MSTKDKDNTLNKIKQFFRLSKTGGGFKEQTDFCLTPEIERELRPETPVNQRCKTLKELGDDVLSRRLDDYSLKKLWDLTNDLIIANKPTEQRHTAFTFYKKLIQGQYDGLLLMRAHFFRVIQNHDVPEDIGHRLELLKTLTDNGKDIRDFEEEIGKFMLQWSQNIIDADLMESYLEILVNIIKYNAAYLDKDVVVGIVQQSCYMSCYTDESRIVLLCLSVLDTVICYAIFPNETLTLCIVALCRTVNKEVYCLTSWKIMRNLLGTDLGYASLWTMCNLLNDPAMHNDEALLRGAVFHTNMCLWGSTGAVVSMPQHCSPSTVLLSFLNALKSRHFIVTFEVVLSIQRLIEKSGHELTEPTWDVLCDIMKSIADNINYYEKNGLTKHNVVHKHFHETLDKIELMLKKDEIYANPDVVFDLIEKVSDDRSEASVFNLIEYRALKISATRPKWLQALSAFMEKFYKMSQTNIRVKAISALGQIMDINRAAYEEEIIDRIAMPNFVNISSEPDIVVRTAIAKLLIDFTLHCDTKRCLELLDIIEKLINRPFDLYVNDGTQTKTESDIQDVLVLVEGLIKIFLVKLYRLPSAHAIRIYHLLVGHLEQHYNNLLQNRPRAFECAGAIRYQIFKWMLDARANATFRIGYPDPANNGSIRFSYYLGIDATQPQHLQQQQQLQLMEPIPAANLTTISIRRGCKAIVRCLNIEKDWNVVQLVLKELPNVLQNKALIQGNDIDALAKVLYNLYFDKNIVDTFVPLTIKPSLTDFHGLVLPAIAGLITYHQFLDAITQKRMIEAFKLGLFSGNPRVCVQALTVMALEIPETFVRLAPDVLLDISKMSNTVTVSIPVLEFLSTLSRLPNHLFANFVQLQYMYVFAIALPYTNPFRYGHYTVSLAHHVIAGWFLKSRLSLRKTFVKYIIDGLESHIVMAIKENKSKVDFMPVNEDSSNRKRSSSLTEQGSRNQRRLKVELKPSGDYYQFHMELAETCIDFMARHTFSPCSALPKRLPTADFLLSGGHTLTWLVGHNLITITTSGCSASPLKNGLCDRCTLLCKSPNQNVKSEASTIPASPELASIPKDNDQPNKSAQESESSDITSSTSSSTAVTPFAPQQRFFRQSSGDGRFSSSSGSLEALSRRGSNPDTDQSSEGQLSNKLENPISLSSGMSMPQMPTLATPQPTTDRPRQLCSCSCTGWAEICIRRPTGSISWVMRIQNQIAYDSFTNEFPLHDLTSLFMPTLGGGVVGNDFMTSTTNENTVVNTKIAEIKRVSIFREIDEEKKQDEKTTDHEIQFNIDVKNEMTFLGTNNIPSSGPIDIPKPAQKGKESAGSFSDPDADNEDDDANSDVPFDDNESRSRNPVRRVNSSPEMSSNWRNPFLNQKGNISNISTNSNSNSQNSFEKTEHDDGSTTNERQENIECQQKKKNFCKDMRVSCEAIPEEMAGSTPPSVVGSVNNDSNMPATLTMVKASGTTTLQESSFAHATSVLISSASLPDETLGPNGTDQNIVPRKQLSADDALQQQNTVSDQQQYQQQAQLQPQPSQMSLKLPMEIQKVTTKPPQSPAPLSPRLVARNAANKIAGATGISSGPFASSGINHNNDSNGEIPRGRSKTISVPNDSHYKHYSRDNLKWTFRGNNNNQNRLREQNSGGTGTRTGISPSFVFLQLYHTGQLNLTERPLKVDQMNAKSIALLDYIPPFETHKIGVLYVGPGQCNNETEMLKNRFGSFRYAEFLRSLGTLVSIKDAKEHNLFIDLESNGRDGNFTYIWQDDIVQVTFHVATLMPNKEQDPNCNEKKKHIGNDYVTIVYNESGEEYNINTIKGQYNYASVVIQPLELGSNRIFVKAKPDIVDYVAHSEPKIVSDVSAPLLARQLALHANLASLVSQSLKTKNSGPYASNWLERLRQIKRIRSKLMAETTQTNSNGSFGSQEQGNSNGINSSQDLSSSQKFQMDNFTTYTQ